MAVGTLIIETTTFFYEARSEFHLPKRKAATSYRRSSWCSWPKAYLRRPMCRSDQPFRLLVPKDLRRDFEV